MRYIRRKTVADYVEDKNYSSDGGVLEDIPKNPDTAIEIELEDGSIVVLLGYTRK